MNLATHINEQAKVVNTSPTERQKRAQNYRMGHVKVHGLDISIENPRGSWREGGSPEKRWRSKLNHHYGYIRRTEGGDGDHVDCYIGPHLKSPHVFVIDQHHLSGGKDFDEHKCFIGFGSKAQAREAYHRAFSDGRGKDLIGHIEAMTVDRFKDWLRDGGTTKPIKRADGGAVFGTQTPQELGEQEPNFLDRAVASGINSVATLPKRAIEASAQDVQHLGEDSYTPTSIGPAIESSLMTMGATPFSAAARSGEFVLGSGPVRRANGEVPAIDWTHGGGSKSVTLGKTDIDYGISKNGEHGEIILVRTPKAERGQGSARTAMEQMINKADEQGTTLFLNADPMDKGVSKGGLERFYKSLGFVKNTGRNKDFTSRAEFVRPPQRTIDQKAAGGRVRMAEGGTPNPFDQIDQPKQSDGNPFDTVDPPKPQEPDVGGMKAAWQGAKSGATFNFADELAGVHAAGPKQVPEFLGPLPARTMVGAARLGVNYFTGKDPEAVSAYEKARDEERHANELAKQQHPYLHMAGEVAGSLPAMAILPEAKIAQGATGALKVASKIAEGAITGGEYGALAGAGEGTDANSRVMSAATGAGAGIIGGGVAGGATAGIEALARPAVGAIRAARDPEAEASRRLTRALQSDQELIAAGKAEGMSPQEWAAARQRGEPVTLADLGSSNTQALLRSAANTSPEGRAVLEKAFNDRFSGQTERVADEVRGLVAGGANANKTGDQLVAEYDKARVPAYKLAYQQGDKEIISPPIEHLMGSPLFEGAMKAAVNGVKDRAIAAGHTVPTNPGVTLENGMLKFTKAKPDGTPIYPNLQYWDAVKKELDGIATMAKRSGDPHGDVAANMSKTLRTELDKAVPSYGNARGIAAQYFGESNALEAGQKLAGKRVDPAQISDIMRKMKPDERDLFREGYASDWANRVISNISDSRDITKAMFNSPNERARALAVFGPSGMETMKSRMALETIMDGARKAMGNSTTARQLIETGLAGGLGGYESGWDPWHMAGAAGATVMGHRALGTTISAGAQKLIGKVDARTARIVADLLTSDDPRKLQQGLRMAQKNPRIAAGLNWMANKMGVAAQSPYRGPNLGPLQGPIPSYADQKQQ